MARLHSDRARVPAVSSVVLAVLTLLGMPWLGLWPVPLWGWGLVLAAHALRTPTPGTHSRPIRVTAFIGLGLNAFLLTGALPLLALSLLRG